MNTNQSSPGRAFSLIGTFASKRIKLLLSILVLSFGSTAAFAVAPVFTLQPDLSSTGSTGVASPLINANFDYVVILSTSGGATTGVTTLKTNLPVGITLVSITPLTGFTCTSAIVAGVTTVTCTTATAIAVGFWGQHILTVKATTLGAKVISSSVSGGGGTTVTASLTTPAVVNTAPDIAISLVQPVPTFKATALSEISVTIKNQGTRANEKDLYFSMSLPAGVTVSKNAFQRNADSWDCVMGAPSTLYCWSVIRLSVGASNTIRIPITPLANTVGVQIAAFTANVFNVPFDLNRTNDTTSMTPTGIVTTLSLGSISDPAYSTVPTANNPYAKPILNPATIPQFAMPLPNLLHPSNVLNYWFSGNLLNLDIKQIKSPILPPGFPVTDVFTYGYRYPAQTIIARSTEPTLNLSGLGQPLSIQYNDTRTQTRHLLPVDKSIHGAMGGEPEIRSVTHLHGIKKVDQSSDGYPEAWLSPNGQTGDQFSMPPTVGYNPAAFNYPNNQEATLLWYHDHTLGMTRLDVYSGLAGLYVVRDDNEMAKIAANQLPSGPYEIPLLLQDRMFHTDGSLAYPDVAPAGTTSSATGKPIPSPSMQPEFFGNVMVVNGVSWPYLEVEPRRYRFRVLNGSNSRFYTLKIETCPVTPAGGVPQPCATPRTFKVIGTEGGFLNAPVTVSSLTVAPAERYDLIVDFTGVAAGTKFTLTNYANSPFQGIPAAGAATTIVTGIDDRLVEFRVNQPLSAKPNAVIPASLRLAAVPALTPTAGIPVRQVMLADNTDEFGRVVPSLGTLAGGLKGWMDPITEQPKAGTIETWEIYNASTDSHPIHLHGGHFQLLNRQTYGAAAPDTTPLQEKTWKDTIIAHPSQITRIKVKFDNAGLFAWHCHILEHEDHDMMRPLNVLP
ncbi:MAG: multicopper oxidase domain-containing protein [Methyloglobulus sp.]|nr:multicopper oxidase domain-containing protein [Methyloglobulus sp.]